MKQGQEKEMDVADTSVKQDPRARYTKELIQRIFLEIIREKPVAKITVSEICAKAQINRGTFYRYYLDVYDLADQMVQDGLDRIESMMDGWKPESFEQSFAEILRLIRDDRQILELVLSESLGNRMNVSGTQIHEPFMEKVFMMCYKRFMDEKDDKADPREKARRLAFITGGSGALIVYWLRSKAKESPEEMAELIGRYAAGVLQQPHIS